LLLAYGVYVEPVETAPAEEAGPVYTKSEQAVIDHQRFCEEIVGHDEDNVAYTEKILAELPAKEELRLRRLFEQGHRGSNLLTIRREILDTKQIQDAERARIAAEENGGAK
jgi:hypothetical protein